MRSLVYFVGMSLDGYIARPDGSTDDFRPDPAMLAALFSEYPETCPAHLRNPLSVTGEHRHFDTVIMGRRTHQPALEAGLSSAYPHLSQVVITHRGLPADPSVTASTDPVAEVRRRKREPGRDLWLCGGGDVAAQLIDEIDEFRFKVYPVLLGSGIPALGGASAELRLIDTMEWPGGVLLTRYVR